MRTEFETDDWDEDSAERAYADMLEEEFQKACDERKTEIELDEHGNITAFKQYAKAKDFQRK